MVKVEEIEPVNLEKPKGGKDDEEYPDEAVAGQESLRRRAILSMFLEPESVIQLDELLEHFGRSKGGRNKPPIAAALRYLKKPNFLV